MFMSKQIKLNLLNNSNGGCHGDRANSALPKVVNRLINSSTNSILKSSKSIFRDTSSILDNHFYSNSIVDDLNVTKLCTSDENQYQKTSDKRRCTIESFTSVNIHENSYDETEIDSKNISKYNYNTNSTSVTETEACFRLIQNNTYSTAEPITTNTNICQIKSLNESSVPLKLRNCQYAVRGKVVARSLEIEDALNNNTGNYPFKEIIQANIGNPLAVGQKSITYNRQVLACLLHPTIIEMCKDKMPRDVIEKSTSYLNAIPSMGAYSHSNGNSFFRQEVANWFFERDGVKPKLDSIFLCDGASSGVRIMLELFIRDERDGIMIPVPQYPLYSASIIRLGGTSVPYYTTEEKGWALEIHELRSALKMANESTTIRALVVINPGNPTGYILKYSEMVEIIKFCEEEHLFLIADEVYQSNIYGQTPFLSFRKVLFEIGSNVELVSIHSTSKGLTGECGIRGGLIQLENVDREVMDIIYKLFSISLCANTVGQALMALILNPPKPGSDSYELYQNERESIFNSLKRKSKMVYNKLNKMEGVCCQPICGAMYAFPRITLPKKAILAAQQSSMDPDLMYCLEMLESTGVVTVPGSGFGQKENTYHYRLTILPEDKKLEHVLDDILIFHNSFLAKYSD